MSETISLDEARQARKLGLQLSTDTTPGISRIRKGKGFEYRSASGQLIKQPAVLKRIASLVIPPAWEKVWICADAAGHVQVTGRDAKGRKQYRYHPNWRAHREATKFEHISEFGEALHVIRTRTESHLRRRTLDREKVLATIVALLERTLIRVGNEEYARVNHHYGLTTLRSTHVTITGSKVHFEFLGKSGQERVVDLVDRRIANIMRELRTIPGREIFHYLGADGRKRTIKSADVNAYLREISGRDFTAKSFRTWAATVMAAGQLIELPAETSKTGTKRALVGMVKQVASRLGNTPTVCRKSYIHPRVIETFLDGELALSGDSKAQKRLEHLTPMERSVLAFLSTPAPKKKRVAA